MAETLEESDHTSVQRRIQAEREEAARENRQQPFASAEASSIAVPSASDRFLSPLELDECHGESGPCSHSGCSDKGFLPMSVAAYLELLDWTARQTAPGKRGSTPPDTPPILERLKLSPATWCELVTDSGSLFSTVAGRPQTVDGSRSRRGRRRFHITPRVRGLFSVESQATRSPIL